MLKLHSLLPAMVQTITKITGSFAFNYFTQCEKQQRSGSSRNQLLSHVLTLVPVCMDEHWSLAIVYNPIAVLPQEELHRHFLSSSAAVSASTNGETQESCQSSAVISSISGSTPGSHSKLPARATTEMDVMAIRKLPSSSRSCDMACVQQSITSLDKQMSQQFVETILALQRWQSCTTRELSPYQQACQRFCQQWDTATFQFEDHDKTFTSAISTTFAFSQLHMEALSNAMHDLRRLTNEGRTQTKKLARRLHCARQDIHAALKHLHCLRSVWLHPCPETGQSICTRVDEVIAKLEGMMQRILVYSKYFSAVATLDAESIAAGLKEVAMQPQPYPTPCIIVLDPLGCHDAFSIADTLRSKLNEEAREQLDCQDNPFSKITLPLITPGRYPEQRNEIDCGLFVCAYAACFLRLLPFISTKTPLDEFVTATWFDPVDDIERLRQIMVDWFLFNVDTPLHLLCS